MKPYRTNLFIYEDEDTSYKSEKYIVNDNEKYFFNKKIRWTNLGYQYNWNERIYPEAKTIVPQEIQGMVDGVNSIVKIQDKVISMNQFQYRAESVIVNFYSSSDYMTGHLDDAEID